MGVRITSSKGMFFVLRKIDCKKKRDMKRRRNLDRGFGKFASNTYTRCHSTRKIEIIIIRGRYTDKLFQNGGFNLHFLSMRSRIQIPPTSSSFCHTIKRRVLQTMPSKGRFCIFFCSDYLCNGRFWLQLSIVWCFVLSYNPCLKWT